MEARQRLDELVKGYWSSIPLLTACRFGVFAALGNETRPASDLAKELDLDARALETVLLGLAALGVVESRTDGFRIAAGFEGFLLPDAPETQASILSHHYNCMRAWANLEQTLRTGEPAPRPESTSPEQDMRNFICGMANISRASSVEVADQLDMSATRRLLDLAGGPGTAAITFAQRNPQLEAVVFDLEGPIGIAREEIEKADLAGRVTTRAGDFYTDDFGEGFDLVYISNIIHMLPPEDTAMIARKAYNALVAGGTLVIKDFLLDDARTTPEFGALFSINMLVSTQGGKSYTLSETREILVDAGFGEFSTVDIAAASRLLVCKKI